MQVDEILVDYDEDDNDECDQPIISQSFQSSLQNRAEYIFLKDVSSKVATTSLNVFAAEKKPDLKNSLNLSSPTKTPETKKYGIQSPDVKGFKVDKKFNFGYKKERDCRCENIVIILLTLMNRKKMEIATFVPPLPHAAVSNTWTLCPSTAHINPNFQCDTNAFPVAMWPQLLHFNKPIYPLIPEQSNFQKQNSFQHSVPEAMKNQRNATFSDHHKLAGNFAHKCKESNIENEFHPKSGQKSKKNDDNLMLPLKPLKRSSDYFLHGEFFGKGDGLNNVDVPLYSQVEISKIRDTLPSFGNLPLRYTYNQSINQPDVPQTYKKNSRNNFPSFLGIKTTKNSNEALKSTKNDFIKSKRIGYNQSSSFSSAKRFYTTEKIFSKPSPYIVGFENKESVFKINGSSLVISNISPRSNYYDVKCLAESIGKLKSYIYNSEIGEARMEFQTADEARLFKRSYHK
ncbi:hypothetical protein HK099_006003 [Clydaea vesicula]|uniref:RRM domain-containing protein n=1 Tax=Clydaea vesicula TaxID=447962 RepID=A0AAD5TYE7_9FUNG|nr:hypothetical protein HK099_006003 [Clydaea vesicula]